MHLPELAGWARCENICSLCLHITFVHGLKGRWSDTDTLVVCDPECLWKFSLTNGLLLKRSCAGSAKLLNLLKGRELVFPYWLWAANASGLLQPFSEGGWLCFSPVMLEIPWKVLPIWLSKFMQWIVFNQCLIAFLCCICHYFCVLKMIDVLVISSSVHTV